MERAATAATEDAGTTYFALTGDVVASRDLPDRAAVQRILRETLEELNRELADAIAAPLRVVAGDEVQGLFLEPSPAVDVVVRIADALHPAAMMWGLGRGALATELDEDVSAVDGPCLHRAREAVRAAASDERWVAAEGFEPPHGEVLAALFGAMWAVRSGWTSTQVKYVRAVRGRKQTEVADRFEVSRQAVSKTLHAARFRPVREAERAARELLRWLGEREAGSGGRA